MSMEIQIEDSVGFALQMVEMNELSLKIWDLLRTNGNRHDVPLLLPYLNSYELPFYHLVGVRNDIQESNMDLQCNKIQELF